MLSFLHFGRFQDHRTALKLTNVGDVFTWSQMVLYTAEKTHLNQHKLQCCSTRDWTRPLRQRPEEGLNHSNSVYMRPWGERVTDTLCIFARML